MLVLSGVLLLILTIHSALCSGLNDEFSVGTSLNKYLYPSKLETEDAGKNDVDKRPKWFSSHMGKRYIEEIAPPEEIMEIIEKIERSPDLQKLLVEKFLNDEYPMDIAYSKNIQQRSRPFTPRYGRDSADTQNLNSRPYPPRFGKRTNVNLPPYLPRLGRSVD